MAQKHRSGGYILNARLFEAFELQKTDLNVVPLDIVRRKTSRRSLFDKLTNRGY